MSSPVFKEMQERKKESAAPLGQLFGSTTGRKSSRPRSSSSPTTRRVTWLIAFFASYATKPVEDGGLGMDRPSVLLATTLAAFGWLIFTMYGGILSDRIGRIRTFQIGYVWSCCGRSRCSC